MRIEPKQPYNLPNSLQESKDAGAERAKLVPESAKNSAGDKFELSPEQRVTQSFIGDSYNLEQSTVLSPERAQEIAARVKSGYYLTPIAAEETAKALTQFHG